METDKRSPPEFPRRPTGCRHLIGDSTPLAEEASLLCRRLLARWLALPLLALPSHLALWLPESLLQRRHQPLDWGPASPLHRNTARSRSWSAVKVLLASSEQMAPFPSGQHAGVWAAPFPPGHLTICYIAGRVCAISRRALSISTPISLFSCSIPLLTPMSVERRTQTTLS